MGKGLPVDIPLSANIVYIRIQEHYVATVYFA